MINESDIKEIYSEDESLRVLMSGIKKLCDIVSTTMGPKGKSVILHKAMEMPVITKDGVSVANHVQLKHPMEQLGVHLVREVANNVVKKAGDGTTTATVLTYNILKEAMMSLEKGSDVTDMKLGMEQARDDIIEALTSLGIEITEDSLEILKQVATISVNNDVKLGELVYKAIQLSGEHGTVTVDEGKGVEDTMELVEGFSFKAGYFSPYFINNIPTASFESENGAYILCSKALPTDINDWVPLLESIKLSKKPLVVIADKIDGNVLNVLVTNFRQKKLNAVFIKAPGFGMPRAELIEEIAILTGADVNDENDTEFHLKDFAIENLGHCEMITVSADNTTIYEGQNDPAVVQARVDFLNKRIDGEVNEYNKDKLRARIAKLKGKIAIIKVGASSETEAKEKRDRVDDAIGSTNAAKLMGVVPGGGITFVRISNDLKERNLYDEGHNESFVKGYRIILEAVRSPFTQIASNAYKVAEVIEGEVMRSTVDNAGYDFKRDEVCDMVERGILDPVGVEVAALENSISVIGTLLTSGGISTDLQGLIREGM